MLDDDLLDFVRASVRSTWALEVLLLLRRHAPDALDPNAIVRTLRATPTLVSGCLGQLRDVGLAARDDEAGAWRFAPTAPALHDLVLKLEAAYAERPVAVISAIVESPNDRLQSFADAFKFPKKGD